MLSFFVQPNPAQTLSKSAPLNPDQLNTGRGLFIPTSVKYFFVTAALWLGLGVVSATFWVGAFSIGATLSAWMSK